MNLYSIFHKNLNGYTVHIQHTQYTLNLTQPIFNTRYIEVN